MNDTHPVKVLCGGSWRGGRDYAHAAARGFSHPVNRLDYYGFRVMRKPGGPATWCALRGGSWNDNQDNARSAYRYWYNPDDRVNDVGFRVMRGSL